MIASNQPMSPMSEVGKMIASNQPMSPMSEVG